MKFFNFKSRFPQKHTRYTLFLSLAIALLLIITEFFFYMAGKETFMSGSEKKLNIFTFTNNAIQRIFIGVRNTSSKVQKLENDRIIDARIKIIKIDKDTIRFFAEQFNESFPFPRRRYAELLDRLAVLHPKAIGFDMEFLTPSANPEDDKLFIDAIKRYNRVVIATSTTFKKDLEATQQHIDNGGFQEEEIYQETLPSILQPKLLNEHTGYASYPKEHDKDDIILFAKPWFNMRRIKHFPRLSFALQLYRHSVNVPWSEVQFGQSHLVIGANSIPFDQSRNTRIHFTYSDGIPWIPLKHFFDDKTFNGLRNNKNYYDNIWLIGYDGVSNQDFSDTHNTPLGRIPGVETHANFLNTVSNKLYVTDLHPYSAPFLAILFSVALGLILPRTSHAIGNILFFVIILSIIIGGYLLLTELRLYLPIFTPLAASVLSFGFINIYHFALEKRNKDRIKSLFAGSVSKKIVDAMLDADNRQKLEAMMKGTKVVVTIFYSDIRGFTSLSEKLSPQEVFSLLNEYFDPMIKIVYKYDGFLDKFIGDCIMAVFSAPEQHQDDPQRAVRAALEMQQVITELQNKWKKEGKTGFSVGMGINTGEVILGSLGVVEEQGKWQMTVIGDAVNLAARLYASAEGGQTLISEYTYKYVADIVNVKPLEPFIVKGKAEPVMAYELLGLKET